MATNVWKGGAIPIPEVKAYIFAGTWAQADTARIAINGKILTLTAGATATVTQLALDMIDLINGAAANGSELRSALGPSVGEFSGLTATAGSAGQVILTGPTNGRPIGTVTPGETTAGDGTFAAVGGAPDTTGTGPNFYSNVSNWSLGSVPVDGADVIFDHTSACSCLYGLEQTDVTPTSVTVTAGFKYAIGLPAVNSDDKSHPYAEPNSHYLVYDGATTVNIDASSAQMVKLDAGTKQTSFNVTNSGSTSETGSHPVLLKGSHASNTLSVASGSVGYCQEGTIAGTLTTVFVGGGQSPDLEIGTGVTATTITQSAGTILNRAAATVTTLNQTGGTFDHRGGTVTTANVAGNFLFSSAATITTAYVTSGGTVDATKDARSKTISNYHMYGGSSLKDPAGSITFTNGIKLYCKPKDSVLDLPARKTYTLGAI